MNVKSRPAYLKTRLALIENHYKDASSIMFGASEVEVLRVRQVHGAIKGRISDQTEDGKSSD